jgi:hypothetical protein
MHSRGRRFAEDDELKHNVQGELRRVSKEFYATGIQRFTDRWQLASIMEATLWKNNLNFVKDVPMIYLNFIIIVIKVSEKKVGGITSIIRSSITILKKPEWLYPYIFAEQDGQCTYNVTVRRVRVTVVAVQKQ